MGAIGEIWRKCFQSHPVRWYLIMIVSSTSADSPSPNTPVSLPTEQSRGPNAGWIQEVKDMLPALRDHHMV